MTSSVLLDWGDIFILSYLNSHVDPFNPIYIPCFLDLFCSSSSLMFDVVFVSLLGCGRFWIAH